MSKCGVPELTQEQRCSSTCLEGREKRTGWITMPGGMAGGGEEESAA